MIGALFVQLEKEVKDALEKQGIGADVKVVSNVLVIKLTKDEIINAIKKQIPQPYANNIEVEANDIVIRVKLA